MLANDLVTIAFGDFKSANQGTMCDVQQRRHLIGVAPLDEVKLE